MGSVPREKPQSGISPKLQIPFPDPGFLWNERPGAVGWGFIDVPDKRLHRAEESRRKWQRSHGRDSRPRIHGCGKENVELGINPGETLTLNLPRLGELSGADPSFTEDLGSSQCLGFGIIPLRGI